jgi:hypothetical protein
MLYHVHILKPTYLGGKPRLIEKRVHTARSDVKEIEHLKKNFSTSAPTASGFLLKRNNGTEIYRWFKPEAKSADPASTDPC